MVIEYICIDKRDIYDYVWQTFLNLFRFNQ